MIGLLNDDLTHDKRLLKSMNLTILSICFGVIFLNTINGAPIAGLAKVLGYGDFLYGLMLALPVLGGVFQVFASFVLEKTRKRKFMFILFGLLQRLPWIVIAILPLVMPKGSIFLLGALIFFMTFSAVANSFVNVSFMSWIADLVPENVRGRFFSRRSMLLTLVAMLSGLVISIFLDVHNNITGFSFIFLASAIFGVIDILCFYYVYDPEMKRSPLAGKILSMFKETIKNEQFRHFIVYFVLWNFALNIAGPYFNMYMIKHLKMGFFEITLYGQIISNIATITTITFWGRIIDRIGNKPMLVLASVIVALLPMMWCFTTISNCKLLVTIINIFAGLAWPIIDLANNNLIFKLSDESQKSMYVASINLFTSVFGIALGIIAGGFISDNVAPVVLDIFSTLGIRFINYHLLFILSTTFRLIAVLYLWRFVKEPNINNMIYRRLFRKVSEQIKY